MYEFHVTVTSLMTNMRFGEKCKKWLYPLPIKSKSCAKEWNNMESVNLYGGGTLSQDVVYSSHSFHPVKGFFLSQSEKPTNS